MVDRKEGYCVSIDEKTINLLDEFSRNHSISRSASIRMIVNDYFLKLGVSDGTG